MPQHKQTHKRKARGDTKFPGICRHAKELGVNRCTLYRVLTGEWVLPKLALRYNTLIKNEGRAA